MAEKVKEDQRASVKGDGLFRGKLVLQQGWRSQGQSSMQGDTSCPSVQKVDFGGNVKWYSSRAYLVIGECFKRYHTRMSVFP